MTYMTNLTLAIAPSYHQFNLARVDWIYLAEKQLRKDLLRMDQGCCPAEQEPNKKLMSAAKFIGALRIRPPNSRSRRTSRPAACCTVGNGYCTAIAAGILFHGLRLQGRQLFREGSRFCAGL